MILSWRAPVRHRYCVLFDGVPIASCQTLDGAWAYIKLALAYDAWERFLELGVRPTIQVFETHEEARA